MFIIKNTRFKNEERRLKKDLGLGDEVKVYVGEDAQKFIEEKADFYKDKYDIDIKKIYNQKSLKGSFYYWENENVILIKNYKDYTCLAHELRHAFQFKNGNLKKNNKSTQYFEYILNDNEYDANKYALKQGIKYGYKHLYRPISAILSRYILKVIPVHRLVYLIKKQK